MNRIWRCSAEISSIRSFISLEQICRERERGGGARPYRAMFNLYSWPYQFCFSADRIRSYFCVFAPIPNVAVNCTHPAVPGPRREPLKHEHLPTLVMSWRESKRLNCLKVSRSGTCLSESLSPLGRPESLQRIWKRVGNIILPCAVTLIDW
jgi:hypothetical protein